VEVDVEVTWKEQSLHCFRFDAFSRWVFYSRPESIVA